MATQTISVLFTDIVGSTELMQRVGEERSAVLRREHFELLREAAAGYRGREVKNLGDGLMFVFESAVDGIDAAVAMQRALERRNRRAPDELLHARIALSAGDADFEDDDYFGVPVVEAARLCAAGAEGDILVSEIVRLLGGTRSAHDIEFRGELELKGLDAPVRAYAVRWETSEAEQVAMPARLRRESSTFVGRTEELDRLFDNLKSADNDRMCRVVMVSGEPGIGKTTLSAELARRARDRGTVVLYGRADEEIGLPYQPWIETLEHLIREAPPELAGAIRAHGGELARLAPTIAQLLDVSPSDTSVNLEAERYVVWAAIVALLSAASLDAPLVIVLDDLHWADRTTLQLLRHVAASTEPLRVLIVGTFRASELTATHPLADLLAASHRERNMQRLDLSGLADTDLLELMEATAGQSADATMVVLRDALARETDGNPFFVGEILRHLAETGALYQDDTGRWRATENLREVGLPVSVREVIGRRVTRLGDAAASVLIAAAVIGRDFDLELLAMVLEQTADDVLDVVEVAERATLVSSVGGERFTFVHALVEHTIYDGLTPARRARLHRRVAEAIETLCGDDPSGRVAELAYHWSMVVAETEPAKAIDYAQQAGDRALAQLAPDEAVRWYAKALQLLSPTDANSSRRCELLARLGEAQRQSGDPSFRETLLEASRAAIALGNDEILVRAALANSRGFFAAAGRIDEERVEVLEAALERPAISQRARARLTARLATELVHAADLDRVDVLRERANVLAHETNDPTTIVAVIQDIQHPATPWTLEARRKRCDEAVTLVENLDDGFLEYWAFEFSCAAAFQAADRDGGDRFLARAHEISERLQFPTLQWNTTMLRGGAAQVDGDYERMAVLAEETYRRGVESGQPDAFTIFTAQISAARHGQDRASEILDLMDERIKDVTESLPSWGPALAVFLAAVGRIDEARATIMPHVEAGLALFPRDHIWLASTTNAANAMFLCDLAQSADVAFEMLLPFREYYEFLGPSSAGPVAEALAQLASLLGRDAAADELFQQAIATNESMRAPGFLARAELNWARAILRRPSPDLERATALARHAVEVADRALFALVAREGRDLLATL
jgi:class 3 adenylate cyclase